MKKKRPFSLSWTTLDLYESCPRQFLWSKGWATIDLGNGLGKPKTRKNPSSWHNALMGVAIGDTIEDLYNKELWRDPKNLRANLEAKLKSRFKELVANPQWPIDWQKSPDQQEMYDICWEGVVGYLATMRGQKLIGTWSASEHKMRGYINPKNPVMGKCDIIFRRKDTGLTILDGKNGQKKINLKKLDPDHYTKPDQLVWYAMLHFLETGEYVNRLGFVYFRFPYNEATEEPGVLWVPFEKEDIPKIAERALKARAGMNAEKFDPTPKPKVCRYCDFELECPERQAQRKANSAKRKKKPKYQLKVHGQDEPNGLEEFEIEDT